MRRMGEQKWILVCIKYRMWELTLGGRLLGFKCEWLSPTSAMNGKNGGAGVDPSLDQLYDVGTHTWREIVGFQV
jgi:hypothetical protein